MARRWRSSDPYPVGASFEDLLEWHLTVWGTNPRCSPHKRHRPWVLRNFATAVHSGLPDGKDETSPDRKLWNWRNGIDLPKLIHDHRILEVLFGDNADLTNWRKDLEDALEAARAAKRKKATGAPRTTFAKTRPIAPPTAYFMGRDEEIATLASRLASATDLGPMLIQGGPGIGKTELTRAIAHQEAVVARFADRRYFVPLDHSVDAESMQHAIMRAVGFEPRYGFAAMLNALREQETLLVLDNLETPWQSQYGPTEEVLAELATIPQVAVLASFRGREAVGGARWHQYALEALPYHSSCDLFCSIAGQKFLSDPLLERFLTALSGNPLAISLVAQRAYGRASLDPLWREWLQNGTRFIEEPQDMGDGITSFAASVDRTFQSHQMTRDALRFLQIATLFPFGLGRREAKIIMGDGAFAAAEAVVRLGLTAEAGHKSGSGVYTYLKVPELILTHVRTFYPINDADQLLVDQFRQTAAALWKDVAACRRATIDEVARFYDAEDDWGP